MSNSRNRNQQQNQLPPVEVQPLSLKGLALLIGSIVVPLVGFGVLAQGTLGDIRMELTLLRRDVVTLQTGQLEEIEFRKWVQVFRAQNPTLNVPPAVE